MNRLTAGLAKKKRKISPSGTECILIYALCKANRIFFYKTSTSSFRWGTAVQEFIFQEVKNTLSDLRVQKAMIQRGLSLHCSPATAHLGETLKSLHGPSALLPPLTTVSLFSYFSVMAWKIYLLW